MLLPRGPHPGLSARGCANARSRRPWSEPMPNTMFLDVLGASLDTLAPPRRSLDRNDGDLELFTDPVIERPDRRSGGVRIAIGHELAIDPTRHAAPLAQRHRAHARLTDVVKIVSPDAPDAKKAGCCRQLQVGETPDLGETPDYPRRWLVSRPAGSSLAAGRRKERRGGPRSARKPPQ